MQNLDLTKKKNQFALPYSPLNNQPLHHQNHMKLGWGCLQQICLHNNQPLHHQNHMKWREGGGGGRGGLQQICLHIKQLTSSSSKSYDFDDEEAGCLMCCRLQGLNVGLQHLKEPTSSSSKSYEVEGRLGWVRVRGGSALQQIKEPTSSSSKSYEVEGRLGWVRVRGGSALQQICLHLKQPTSSS